MERRDLFKASALFVSLIGVNASALTLKKDDVSLEGISSVESIEMLKSVSIINNRFVLVAGYSNARDGGGGIFMFDKKSNEHEDGGIVFKSSTRTEGRWIRIYDGAINLLWFGADRSGINDSTRPIKKWLSFIIANKESGYIPSGRYKSMEPLHIDIKNCASAGLKIYGDGFEKSIIDLTHITNITPFSIFKSNGHTNGDAFYISIKDLSIHANIDSHAVSIGSTDLSDVINASEFNIYVANSNKSINACALQINALVQSELNITANCSGNGNAIEINQMQFCNLTGSAGNATNGLYFSNGYSFGNIITNIDVEVVECCVKIDSKHTSANTFLGGQFVWTRCAIDAVSGKRNMFINPNFGSPSNVILNGEGISILDDIQTQLNLYKRK